MKRKIISVLFVTVLALVLTNCGATQVAPLTNPTAAAVPTATPVPPPPTATHLYRPLLHLLSLIL